MHTAYCILHLTHILMTYHNSVIHIFSQFFKLTIGFHWNFPTLFFSTTRDFMGFTFSSFVISPPHLSQRYDVTLLVAC